MNSPKLLSSPNSGDTFYFRSYVPKDLLSHFGGVKQFRISLKCTIKSRSTRTTKILAKTISGIYEEIRQGMKSLDVEQIKEILRIEIRKQILHAHQVDLGTNKWSELGVEQSLDSIKQKDSNLRKILENDLNFYRQQVDLKLKSILESLDIEVKKESVPYRGLRNNFIELYLLRHQWMRDLVSNSGKTDDEFRRDAEMKLGINLFPDVSIFSKEPSKLVPQTEVTLPGWGKIYLRRVRLNPEQEILYSHEQFDYDKTENLPDGVNIFNLTAFNTSWTDYK